MVVFSCFYCCVLCLCFSILGWLAVFCCLCVVGCLLDVTSIGLYVVLCFDSSFSFKLELLIGTCVCRFLIWVDLFWWVYFRVVCVGGLFELFCFVFSYVGVTVDLLLVIICLFAIFGWVDMLWVLCCCYYLCLVDDFRWFFYVCLCVSWRDCFLLYFIIVCYCFVL